jgi:hypothetical protein
MVQQNWIMGALGSLMVGGAAAIFLLANGRTMGASPILGGLDALMFFAAMLAGRLVAAPIRLQLEAMPRPA